MHSSFKTTEDLPATLSATDISRYLGISKANSYQILNELRRIGVNVNQIARACNSGYKTNPSVALFQKELKNIWQSLKSKPPKEL